MLGKGSREVREEKGKVEQGYEGVLGTRIRLSDLVDTVDLAYSPAPQSLS